MKLYIAVLDEVPNHMVPVLVSHGVLGAHLDFSRHYIVDETGPYKEYVDWLEHSFKKVVLKVNSKEYRKIAALENTYQGHENTVLGGMPTCVVVCPRVEYPNVIKFAHMWKPND